MTCKVGRSSSGKRQKNLEEQNKYEHRINTVKFFHSWKGQYAGGIGSETMYIESKTLN